MQIVIPMSGQGSRFKAAGYTDIKPLIKVQGKPMIEYVVQMFPGETDFVFICNEDHLETTPLRAELERIMADNGITDGTIVGVDSHKKGPNWAVLEAADHIKDDEPIIVNYTDFNCVWDYPRFKKFVEENECAGAIPSYIGFHPHLLGPNLYASCKVDENNKVEAIKEKFSWTEEKMNSWQSSGTYYFNSGALAKEYMQKQVDEDISLKGEYYTSLTYQLLLHDELPVYVYKIDQFCQWGTPADLEEFNYWAKYFTPSQ